MTGYGRAEITGKGCRVAVEMSSVNRRQAEIAINLPRELEVLEAQARDLISHAISRGRISAKIVFQSLGGSSLTRMKINHTLARSYLKELHQLTRELKLDVPVNLEQILRIPGVIEPASVFEDAESFWPLLEKSLRQALKDLTGMREREGAHLAQELKSRIKLMRKATDRVARQAPKVTRRYREQLTDRIKKSGVTFTDLDADRLLKEVVIFTDRADISEELTRMRSHFEQFEHYAASREPVGRTLDFLAQEMNREINTMGAKANDSQISREIVVLKTELEKFREQVQNVE